MKKVFFFVFLISAFASCNQAKELELSPLQKLEEGNQRFASGKPAHPDATIERVHQLEEGQHPFAVVVSCSDSRVPVELVFDQGLGDIFSIRTAGNVIGDYELGSLEYAVEHLDCKLIVVMGHKSCGAVKAFLESKGNYTRHDHIKSIVDYISNEAEEQALVSANELTVDKAIGANVAHGVAILKNSGPILKERFEKGDIQIVGAVYDIATGKIAFNQLL